MDPVERVIYAVDKALPKLSPDRINVVVVADDLFFSPTEIPQVLLLGRLATMLLDERYRNVSGIFMLNAVSYSEGPEVEYRARFIANVNATKPLPDGVTHGLLGVNDNPHGPRRLPE